MTVLASVVGTTVESLVVDVTGPGIQDTIVAALSIAQDTARGTVTVPAGSNRTFTIHAFDASGIETHQGSTTVNVQASTNNAIIVVLSPLVGHQPIEGHFATPSISLTAGHDTITVADTIRVLATVNGSDGEVVVDPGVQWASDAPWIATVDSTGLVSGRRLGVATIYGTYLGVSSHIDMIVQ